MMLFKDDAPVATEVLQYWFQVSFWNNAEVNSAHFFPLQFNLDKYYEKIKEYTFESYFITVTRSVSFVLAAVIF